MLYALTTTSDGDGMGGYSGLTHLDDGLSPTALVPTSLPSTKPLIDASGSDLAGVVGDEVYVVRSDVGNGLIKLVMAAGGMSVVTETQEPVWFNTGQPSGEPSATPNAVSAAGPAILVGTTENGAAYSLDGGASWAHEDFSAASITDRSVNPRAVFTDGEFFLVGTSTGLQIGTYSADGLSLTWSKFLSGQNITSVYRNAGILYIGTAADGGYASGDLGAHWTNFNKLKGLPQIGGVTAKINQIIQEGADLYVATSLGVYRLQ